MQQAQPFCNSFSMLIKFITSLSLFLAIRGPLRPILKSPPRRPLSANSTSAPVIRNLTFPFITFLEGSSMNLGNDGGIEDGFNSSVGFGSEEVMLNTLDANQLTVCVWCRTEFKLEGIESETPSDSIGYMCPTCKAKISGHFGGGLSMYPHDF